MFSPIVSSHWFAEGEPPSTPGAFRVAVDDGLPDDRRLQVLAVDGAGGILRLDAASAATLGVDDGAEVAASALRAALESAGIALNGADAVFYFPEAAQPALRAEPVDGSQVRRLTPEDAGLFAAFQAETPEDDLDEAFVELDHWLVYGSFADGRLAAAASMYPWSGTSLADLGVVTLPALRGRGHGRRVVRAIGAAALERHHEPQYRCQLDNRASVALAGAAGLVRFATWDVVASAD